MASRPTYVITVILLVLLVTGCGRARKADREAFTDDLGRRVELALPAERVATLAPNLTEIVFAVGAGDRLVGAGIPDDYPPAVESLPRYSTYPVDFEALAALDPDLVLATDQVNSPRTAETLSAIGIPTYFLSFSALDDVFTGMETIGRLLGTTDQAVAATDSLRQEVRRLRSLLGSVRERPTVLYLIGQETLFSFGDESYIHELIRVAGGRSITEEIGMTAPVLSEEFVLARAPDVIMGPWADSVDAADILAYHPSWHAVPAVVHDRVYGVHADLVSRPGPRLVAGARAMAQLLHPDRFNGPEQESAH